MFSSINSESSINMIECLKLKITTNNRLVQNLYDKILNVDLKSILLEKPLDKVHLLINFLKTLNYSLIN